MQLIGTGFNANEEVKVKWGVVQTDILPKDSIQRFLDDDMYSEDL